MQFAKSIITNGLTLGFLRVKHVDVSVADNTLTASLQCWVAEADYVAGLPPPWVFPLTIPIPSEMGPLLQAGLLASPELSGATALPDALDTLDGAKVRKWAAIKTKREEVEFGGFVMGASTFDSDTVSQGRITGAVVLAMLATQAGMPFSQDWTLADNTSIPLDAPGMMAVGAALGQHVGGTHAVARTLRAAIEAATTLEELEEVQWPV